MALNDGENGGDIGYIYFSNMPTQSTPLTSLPVLEEKIVFSELKGLQILGKPKNLEEIDVSVRPGEELIFLMKKTGTEQSSYKV